MTKIIKKINIRVEISYIFLYNVNRGSMKKYRYVILITFFAVILALGVTYSYYVSNNDSNSQVLETGEVYVTVNGSTTINLNDIVPIEGIEVNSKAAKYTFSLTGKNNSDTDLEYKITFIHGNDVESKVRLGDSFIHMSLKEKGTNDVYQIINKSMADTDNYYIGTIPANTNSEITKNYELLIWVQGQLTNTTNLYANFKINVEADFNDNPSTTNNPTNNQYLINKIINGSFKDNVSSTYVTSSSGINFNNISSDTNGKGVYQLNSTSTNYYPIYYYRGAVTNNNAIFSNYCWKIVRTTDNGGIKMIYNGTPSDGHCTNTTGAGTQISTSVYNTETNSPAYNGYMYGEAYTPTNGQMTSGSTTGTDFTWDAINHEYNLTNTSTTIDTTHHYTCNNTTGKCSELRYYFYVDGSSNYLYITLTDGKSISDALNEMKLNKNSSTIKTAIDTWYAGLQDKEECLADAVYCNDRSVTATNHGWNPTNGTLNANMNYAAYTRATAGQPSLNCSKNDAFTVNESSMGNGALTKPIGLITSDEMIYAGAKASTANNTYYLYTGQNYWTMSPYYNATNYTDNFIGYNNGGINGDNVNVALGIRPVITLLSNVEISEGSEGDGTANSPYIIAIIY